MADEKKIPELKLTTNTEEAYCLEGWEEVDRWARCNYRPWANMTELAHAGAVSEEDRLRLLCRFLLGQVYDLQSFYLKHAPCPAIIIEKPSPDANRSPTE